MTENMTPIYHNIAVRMANEGIPVLAIARSLAVASADIFEHLNEAKDAGEIFDVPSNDWPPKGPRHQMFKTKLSETEMMFICRQTFSLTPLQSAFMATLLRNERVDKAKLHTVIENQRRARWTKEQPDEKEPTEPKMVDVIICHLRKKLRIVNRDIEIKTDWGTGYYMVPEVREMVMRTYITKEDKDAEADLERGSDPGSTGPVLHDNSGRSEASL